MKLSIAGWETENLRCPDMEVNLVNSSGNIPPVSLIQMPNGTGKSTIEMCINLALKNKTNFVRTDRGSIQASEEVIRELKDDSSSKNTGKFILNLYLENQDGKGKGIISITQNFNFIDGSVEYETDSTDFDKNSGTRLTGKIRGWDLPEEIEPFLREEVVDLFVLEGNKAEDLLKNSNNGALKSIQAFSGLESIDKLQALSATFYSDRKKGSGAETNASFNKYKTAEKEINKKIKNFKLEVESLLKKQSMAASVVKELGAAKAKLEDGDSKLKELLDDKENKKLKLNESKSTIIKNMKNPMFFSEVADGLISFSNTLGKLNLPGLASESFFLELVLEDDCICGEKMSPERKKIIKANSKKYLKEEYFNTVNIAKNKIESFKNKDRSDFDSEWKAFNEDIGNYNKSQNKYQLKKGQVGKGTLTEAQMKRLLKAEGELESCKNKLEIFNDPQSFQPEDCWNRYQKDSNSLEAIKELEAVRTFLTNKIAEITGNKKLKDSHDEFTLILEKIRTQAEKNIVMEIIKETNKFLEKVMPECPKITGIKDTIEFDQSGVSQGQSLASIYCFIAGLLNKTNHDFPILVDHPFEGLQDESRRELAKAIPDVCHQYIGFLINSEKSGSLYSQRNGEDRGFKELDIDINYITISKNTPRAANFFKKQSKNKYVELRNGYVSYDIDIFDNFELEKD